MKDRQSVLAQNAPRHIPALDGARGMAALVVVVSHAANAGMLPDALGSGLGQSGVALFYALSGLLMARLYLHRSLTRHMLWSYAVSRGARVLPLFYAALCAGLVLFAFLGVNPYYFETAGDALRAAALIEGTGVLWSIPVEVQFYFVFAAIWWAATKGQFLAALACVLAIQVTFCLSFGITSTGREYFTIFYWGHFFLIGCIFGDLLARGRFPSAERGSAGWAHAIGWLVLALAVLAPPEIRRSIGMPVLPNFIDPLTGGLPVVILICAVLRLGPFVALEWPVMRWLGGISYSIYLLHMIVIVAVGRLGLDDFGLPGLAFAAVLGGTLAFSHLSQALFEGPAQRLVKARLLQPAGMPKPEF